MEATINGRLVELIKALKMSNLAFAKSIDKSSSTINYISDGKGKPSYDVLESIFTVYPNVSRDWLLMGEGEMFRKSASNSNTSGDNYLQDYLSRLETQFKGLLAEKQSIIEDLKSVIQYQKELLGKPEGVPSSQIVSQGIRTTPLQITHGAELGRVFKKFGS